jgi:D-aminoacyl-tRNA deacylase
MKTVIICSLLDPAGTNIKERLLENFDFRESNEIYDQNPVYRIDPDISLVTSRQGIVFVDGRLDDEIRADRAVFISRHYAESGIPSLTAHFTGNFGSADFGGNPREISRYSPSLLKSYLQNLRSVSQGIASLYNITLEATHHGPTSLKPTAMFVELGSSISQWKDIKAAEEIAMALMETLHSTSFWERCGICVGGTHYSEKFNTFLFDSEFALGPVVPKYALEFLTPEITKQMIEKSDQPVRYALIDRKGLGKFKEKVYTILEDLGLEKIFV